MALWTMLYGLVQGMAPAIMRITTTTPVSWTSIVGWAVALALALIGILTCMIVKMDVPLLITGLLVFWIFFAVNSSLHSFLIVAYAGSKKAAEDIGFYYAANAAGRLAGTFLSGFLYYQGGLLACLAGSALFLIITALMVAWLPPRKPKFIALTSRTTMLRFWPSKILPSNNSVPTYLQNLSAGNGGCVSMH